MNLPFDPAEPDSTTEVDIYSEQALWLCENPKTRFKTKIHGALAQILKKYPGDYRLKLLKIKGAQHEHTPATGE
ncbi:hypothetical protein [Vampirovibrio sp.]|uniref:hypothetical protein n=1 Tax=Vampirovibrio sp. TaxID=2717857 RepID=UPI003593D753